MSDLVNSQSKWAVSALSLKPVAFAAKNIEAVMDMSDEAQKPKRRYKARARKLVLTDPLLQQLTTLAEIQCTQKEAAGVLGVSHRLLVQFLAEQPEAREAWDRGRGIGRLSLRRLLWKQAQVDPAQARFLAKHWLDMGSNPRQRAPDTDKPQMSHEERVAWILELQRRVLLDRASEAME